MAICPVCNAFEQLEKSCTICQAILKDKGKVTDFLDPYGHYNDIDTLKSADGYANTLGEKLCPHLLYCFHCDHEQIEFVQEQ